LQFLKWIGRLIKLLCLKIALVHNSQYEFVCSYTAHKLHKRNAFQQHETNQDLSNVKQWNWLSGSRTQRLNTKASHWTWSWAILIYTSCPRKLANSMEQSPCWEANSHSHSSPPLWILKIHYHVPKSQATKFLLCNILKCRLHHFQIQIFFWAPCFQILLCSTLRVRDYQIELNVCMANILKCWLHHFQIQISFWAPCFQILLCSTLRVRDYQIENNIRIVGVTVWMSAWPLKRLLDGYHHEVKTGLTGLTSRRIQSRMYSPALI
jgi:hypothetical protein